MLTLRGLFLGALFFICGGAPSAHALGPVSISVSIDAEEANQTVYVCVYRDSRGFPFCNKSSVLRQKGVTDTYGRLVIQFDNMEVGTYAVSAFADVNKDGKLNRTRLGFPNEPIGLATVGDSRSRGRPSFKKSRFTVDRDVSLTVEVRRRTRADLKAG